MTVKEKRRVIGFDLIRLFACFCVIMVHFNANVSGMFQYPNSVIPNHYLEGRLYLGDIGVSLFFILSGVTQMLSYKKEKLSEYYRRRFLGIFPYFWLAYAGATAADIVIHRGINLSNPHLLLYSITGLDGYFCTKGILSFQFYKLGEWFLGCILLLYLSFPLLYYGTASDRRSVVTVLLALAVYCAGIRMRNIGSYNITLNTFYMRIPEFLIGMFIAKYRLWEKDRLVWLSAGSLAAFICAWFFRNCISVLTLTIAFCLVLFCLILWLSKLIPEGRDHKVLTYLSALTFPVYLIHHWIINKMVRFFDLSAISKGTVLLLLFCFFAVCLILSALLKFLGDHLKKALIKYLPERFTNTAAVSLAVLIALLSVVLIVTQCFL